MLPWSAFIWKAIPQLAILQFPWRLCAIPTVAVAGLLAVAVDSCLRNPTDRDGTPSRAAVIFLAVAAIGGGVLTWRVDFWFRHPQTAYVDPRRQVDPIYPSYVSQAHLAEFAKSVGTTLDNDEVALTRVDEGVRAEFTEGRGVLNVVRIGPRQLRVSAQSLQNARVNIGQVYTPLWRIVPRPGSSFYPVLRSSAEGLMEVLLAPGQHEFDLVFDGGTPERLGMALTLTSILVVAAGLVFNLYYKYRWTGRTERP
jgi:hypothetical protein